MNTEQAQKHEHTCPPCELCNRSAETERDAIVAMMTEFATHLRKAGERQSAIAIDVQVAAIERGDHLGGGE